MAKKRKLVPKSAETSASQQAKQQKLDEAEAVEEQQSEPPVLEEHNPEKQEELVAEQANGEENAVDDDEEEEIEVEVEEEVEEEEEEVEEVEEEDDVGNDDDEDPIISLLEPFTKDQLIDLLVKAAESHPDIASQIKKIANQDTVHRKIFVHGLGWDTTADTLRSAFSEFGEIEDCKAVTDKVSGKSKGYGFIMFKSRAGARRALQEPQKKIGNRMTACQLAATGPVPGSTSVALPQPQASEYTLRKIYVSNVSAEMDPQKLTAFFAKFGEIEEGPLGLDKHTGKPKGFCLFVYRSLESAKRALEEPHKHYEGNVLHVQRAIDGPKATKQGGSQHHRGHHYGRNDNSNLAGSIVGAPATGAGLMGQSAGGVSYSHGGQAVVGQQALNPALGQALSALLASQGQGIGLNTLLGGMPGVVGGGGAHRMQVGYGAQGAGMNQGMIGGYGAQGGLQNAYPSQQAQGGTTRPQYGYMGGMAPYGSH